MPSVRPIIKRERLNDETLANTNATKRQRTDADASTLPAAKRRSYFDTFADTIKIDVPECENYHDIHAGLLAQQSPWCASKIEMGKEVIKFDLPYDIFCIFRLWLYTGKLVAPDVDAPGGHPSSLYEAQEPDPDADETPEWDDALLATLYCFARRYGFRHLQNDIVTTIIAQNERCDIFAEQAAVRIVFAGCAGKSHLAAYMIDERVRDGMKPEHVPNDLETWPREFLAGFIRAAAAKEERRVRGHESPTIKTRDACAYHDHLENRVEAAACQEKLNAMLEYLH